jgi:hypothetical protein
MIFLVSNSACSQNSTNKVIGSWLYKGVSNNKKQVIECPDVLVFNKDGNYSILNECYGDDIENPLVEQGQWIFDSKEKTIKLKSRKFSTNYTFHDSSPILILYINESTDKSLKICFNNGKCIAENYEKTHDDNKVEDYRGIGGTVKELHLNGKVTSIKLSYEFYKEPDQLIVEDQNGKQLFKTGMTATHRMQSTTVPLNGVSKLFFKINSEQPNSKWRFKVELQ